MNNLKKLLLITTLLLGAASFAQSEPTTGVATISSSFCLTLEGELTERYVADASALNWVSADEAEKACGFHSSNLVSYQSDYTNNQLIIIVHTDRTYESKDLNWWNTYLTSVCK